MVQDIGSKIYRLRREKKLTQEELANQRKVSEKEIRDWENGVSVPSLAQTKELADFFSVTIEDLIGDENTKEEKTLVIKEKNKEKREEKKKQGKKKNNGWGEVKERQKKTKILTKKKK